MKLTNTVNTTQSFDRWWNETGQFVGVAAQSTGDELELLRRYAKDVIEDTRSQTDWEDLEKERDELDEQVDALTDFKDSIEAILKDATTPNEKVDAIWTAFKETKE